MLQTKSERVTNNGCTDLQYYIA